MKFSHVRAVSETRMGKRETKTVGWRLRNDSGVVESVFFYDKLGTKPDVSVKFDWLNWWELPYPSFWFMCISLVPFTCRPVSAGCQNASNKLDNWGSQLFIHPTFLGEYSSSIRMKCPDNDGWHTVTPTMAENWPDVSEKYKQERAKCEHAGKGFQKDVSGYPNVFRKRPRVFTRKVHLGAKCCVRFEGCMCQGRYNPWGYTHETFLWPTFHNKRRSGFRGTREEDNMNIIFWILEENIPRRPTYEYLMNLAFSTARCSGEVLEISWQGQPHRNTFETARHRYAYTRMNI